MSGVVDNKTAKTPVIYDNTNFSVCSKVISQEALRNENGFLRRHDVSTYKLRFNLRRVFPGMSFLKFDKLSIVLICNFPDKWQSHSLTKS